MAPPSLTLPRLSPPHLYVYGKIRTMTIAGSRNALVAALAVLVLGAQAAEPFKIVIERKYKGSDCTSGYVAINGKAKMYALEKPWQNNATDMSSIPQGTYKASLRYDHTDQWRIELQDVPNRPNIQIHIGNTTQDTKGCILVGMGLANGQMCQLSNSADAYKALKKEFYGSETPISTPDKTITVEMVD